MAHVLRYAFKSTQATVQLVLAALFGILAVLLLFSTVFRWRHEATLREAIQQYGTSEGDPLALFDEARQSRPDDLLPHLFFGQIQLEKGTRLAQDQAAKGETSPEAFGPAMNALKSAIKSFDTACVAREKIPNTTESAPVGAACARIALAELDAGTRTSLLEEAGKVLDAHVRERDDVDVTITQAALQFARGDLAGCAAKLNEANPKLSNAGRGAMGSYYWHKGLLGLLNKEQSAFDDLRRASFYRRGPSASKMIALAYRIATTETFKESKDLEARLLALHEVIGQKAKGKSRYEFDPIEESACWNAMGMGWLRLPNAEKATFCFQRAVGLRPDMLLYKVNAALAIRLKAEMPEEKAKGNPEASRKNFDFEAANAMFEALNKVDMRNDSGAAKEAKEKFIREHLMIAVGIYYGIQRYSEAANPLMLAHDKFGLEDKEFFRTQGALSDWLKRLDQATPQYKKAIAAGHKEAYKMQERVDLWERSKR